MNTILLIAAVIVAFLAGILVGRANPKKADKLAGIAEDIKQAAKHKVKKKG
ncbi:MAG: hypothetical protein AB1423_14525 [Pseudomonadota bacterium]